MSISLYMYERSKPFLFEWFYAYSFRVLIKSVGVPGVIIVMLSIITNMNKKISNLLQVTMF